MRISDWSSDVCSSDLGAPAGTQRLCHQRNHLRLAERLPLPDRNRQVFVRLVAEAVGREHLARDALDGGEHLGIGDPRAAQFHDEADLARCCHYSNTFSMRFMVSRWVRSRCSGVTEMPPSAVTARSVSVSEESSTW